MTDSTHSSEVAILEALIVINEWVDSMLLAGCGGYTVCVTALDMTDSTHCQAAMIS